MVDISALFLHVLAAIGLLAGGTVQVLAGSRVRSASTAAELATWARFARRAGRLIVVSAFISLMTGGHLAGAVWTTETRSGFSLPFISLGAAGLLLLAPVGPMVGGARLRRLAEQADTVGEVALPSPLAADATSPTLWGAVYSLVGVGIGLVALMVYKPGWVAGSVLLIVSFAAGWLAGALGAGRPARP